MAASIVLARRFRGPPDSGNGGYTCGVVATHLSTGPAEVTLRRPPLLERPLRVGTTGDGAVVLVDDALEDEGVTGAVIAEARLAAEPVAIPPVVGPTDVDHAAREFDAGRYRRDHAFPGCFTCGPDRDVDDGLRLFPAPVGPGVVAWPWSPSDTLPTTTGLVAPEIVWAALDCPGGLAWIDGPGGSPAVLGRMRAELRRRPAPGERLTVVGWRAGSQGRRRLAGSAIVAPHGEVLAAASAVWVVLRDDQHRAFGTT